MKNVTHRCNGHVGYDQTPCKAYRTSDGEMEDTCGEPCRWVMGKGGEGIPPFCGSDEFEPSMSDLDNVAAYMLRVSIVTIKITVDD